MIHGGKTFFFCSFLTRHENNQTECLQYFLDTNCPLPSGWRYEHGELHVPESETESETESESEQSFLRGWIFVLLQQQRETRQQTKA